jgi:hypothetical protein
MGYYSDWLDFATAGACVSHRSLNASRRQDEPWVCGGSTTASPEPWSTTRPLCQQPGQSLPPADVAT